MQPIKKSGQKLALVITMLIFSMGMVACGNCEKLLDETIAAICEGEACQTESTSLCDQAQDELGGAKAFCSGVKGEALDALKAARDAAEATRDAACAQTPT